MYIYSCLQAGKEESCSDAGCVEAFTTKFGGVDVQGLPHACRVCVCVVWVCDYVCCRVCEVSGGLASRWCERRRTGRGDGSALSTKDLGSNHSTHAGYTRRSSWTRMCPE